MKEMNYINAKEPIKEILLEDDYLGYHFLIVSYGIHPCAYVEIPKDHRWHGKKYDDEELYNIDCHGGLTYADNLSHVLGTEESNQRWFIGWDYAHAGDFEGYYLDERWGGSFKDDKKWTTEEILNEVKTVIEQIIKMDETRETYKEGEVVLYQNGNRFELGIVKKVCGGDDYFINYHTGDTAARTNARNLHKVANAYAFHIIRLDPDGNERR